MLIPDVWNADVLHWKNFFVFSTFWCFFTVQFCGKNPGAPGPDSQATGGRDRLQDHGARQRLHERQEEGKTLFSFFFFLLLFFSFFFFTLYFPFISFLYYLHFYSFVYFTFQYFLSFPFLFYFSFPFTFFFLFFYSFILLLLFPLFLKCIFSSLFFLSFFLPFSLRLKGLWMRFYCMFFFFIEGDHILPLHQNITNRCQM